VPGVEKQIIIVDDSSSDGTTEWLTRNLGQATGVWRSISVDGDGELQLSADGTPVGCSFTILLHQRNRGKGAAVRTGLACVSGDVVVIQDADLEYDPTTGRECCR
jgi:glycosyltransferase involved in cell wall biosynthesis